MGFFSRLLGTDLESQKRRAFAKIEKNKFYCGDAYAQNYSKADWLTQRGGFFVTSGKIDQAEHDYNEAIQLCPDYLSAYFGLSVVHCRRHNFQTAIEVLQNAPNQEHLHDFDILSQMILTYLAMGDRNKILHTAEKALNAAELPKRREMQEVLKSSEMAKAFIHPVLATSDEDAVKRIRLLIEIINVNDNGVFIRNGSQLGDMLEGFQVMKKYLGSMSDNVGKKALSVFFATVVMSKNLFVNFKSEVELLKNIDDESNRRLFDILLSIMCFKAQRYFWENIISDQELKSPFQTLLHTYQQIYICDPIPIIKEYIDYMEKNIGSTEYQFVGNKVCKDVLKMESEILTEKMATIYSQYCTNQMVRLLKFSWDNYLKDKDIIYANTEEELWKLDIPYFRTGNQRMLKTILEALE